jgi:hypothetical protein
MFDSIINGPLRKRRASQRKLPGQPLGIVPFDLRLSKGQKATLKKLEEWERRSARLNRVVGKGVPMSNMSKSCR